MSAQKALWEVAVDRCGYVTTNDARMLGIAPVTLRQLVQRGQLESAAHGVYRFSKFPVTEYDHFMLAVLWTVKVGTRLSGETALATYEACDINPTKIHLCLPTGARTRRRGGEGYELHYENLQDHETAWWQNIPTVTLNTAIRQCFESNTPTYLLRQAVEFGARCGQLLPSEVAAWNERLEARNG